MNHFKTLTRAGLTALLAGSLLLTALPGCK